MGDEVVEALAKLLHESGRAAVELGMVYAVPSDRKPFCEWSELPDDAKTGRRMMAAYLIEHAHDVIALLEATLPVDANTDAPPAPEAVPGGKGNVEGAV